jgi:aryl-alcohol dehydrogenase-like predicted oxidoreductase
MNTETKMRYKILGNSGLRVSELALGTMTFGPEWGWGADHTDSKAMFEAYANAGGNFIDTANRYTEGSSERFVGEFIAADRDHFVVATKYTLKTRNHDPNFAGNHRKNLVQSLDASLKRLGTDYIDVYWLHAWDFTTPVEAVMRALDDQVRQGKILHIGISDTPAWIVAKANTIADLRGWTPFSALQIEYSLIERTPERELLPMAAALGLAVTPWGALGSGLLTGKYTQTATTDHAKRLKDGSGRLVERNLNIAQAVDAVAAAVGQPASQVALNWVRQQGKNIIPIIGARRAGQVAENIAALQWLLSPEHMAELSTASRIELGFPHDFLASPGVRDVVYAGVHDQIDLD